MNSLSWLIYAIGLFENLREWASGGGLGFLLFMTMFFSVMGYGGSVFAHVAPKGGLENDTEYQSRLLIAGTFRKISKSVVVFCIAMYGLIMLIGVVVPKKETMMYIAASEIGMRIAQNEVFQKNALEALEGSKDALKDVGGFGGEILGLSQDSVKLLRSYMQSQIKTDEKTVAQPETPKETK